MSWAANHDGSLGVLHKVQDSLTVSLIMTPRQSLATCSLDETAAQIKARNPNKFSFFPVIGKGRQIIGLYDASRWFDDVAPNTKIGDDFIPIYEGLVIGSDTSIVDFVRFADDVPTRLVTKGPDIGGLVSLSDLQKLPVRAALFTMITSLEIAMAKTIERAMPEPNSWKSLLTKDRRAKLELEVIRVLQKDLFISEIASTQFSDKADILIKANLLGAPSKSYINKTFKRIRKLRDAVAHSNAYAETPEMAREVCETVRQIERLKFELREEPSLHGELI